MCVCIYIFIHDSFILHTIVYKLTILQSLTTLTLLAKVFPRVECAV